MRSTTWMRRSLLVLAAIYAIAAALGAASAQQCVDGDPSGTIAKVHGNFEHVVDPNDPAQNLIYVNEVANGRSQIVVALTNGVTGQIVPNSLKTIADNFDGLKHINGPEFFMPPGRGLGVIYRDVNGVHGVFRPVQPTSWSDFSLTVDGQPAGKDPPRVSSSYRRSYDDGDQPLGQNTYALIRGPCNGRCFASILGGVPTDAETAFKREADLTIPTLESVVHSERDYVIYAEACTDGGRANGTCGLYEATIDQAGGFQKNSLTLLTKLPARVGPIPGRVPLAAGVHPVTGSTVFFVSASHESGTTIDVYERKVLGGPLDLIASVPASYDDHFRIRNSPTEMVLDYLVRPLGDRPSAIVGHYEIPVTASGSTLQVGTAKKISSAPGGAEIQYLPAAGKFVIFYQSSPDGAPNKMEVCTFVP